MKKHLGPWPCVAAWPKPHSWAPQLASTGWFHRQRHSARRNTSICDGSKQRLSIHHSRVAQVRTKCTAACGGHNPIQVAQRHRERVSRRVKEQTYHLFFLCEPKSRRTPNLIPNFAAHQDRAVAFNECAVNRTSRDSEANRSTELRRMSPVALVVMWLSPQLPPRKGERRNSRRVPQTSPKEALASSNAKFVNSFQNHFVCKKRKIVTAVVSSQYNRSGSNFENYCFLFFHVWLSLLVWNGICKITVGCRRSTYPSVYTKTCVSGKTKSVKTKNTRKRFCSITV